MKVSEMSETQKKAYRNICNAANDLIGGFENTLLDNSPNSKEYKNAKEFLTDHKSLVNELYRQATTAIFTGDACIFNTNVVSKLLREINFCGKDWLMERCEKRITKMGY